MDNAIYITEEILRARLLPLKKDAHKGDNGILNIVAGSESYRGAADLCVGGALRTGCGIVRLMSKECVISTVAERHPSCTFSVCETQSDYQNSVSLHSGGHFLIGCGIGKNAESLSALKAVLSFCKSCVLDADALNIISEHDELTDSLRGNIITPHVGEFSRLTGLTIANIKADAVRYAREFSERFGCVTVLKDCITVIAVPNGKIYISDRASCGLSKGGSGDVLAGIIGGILAQGYSCEDAAVIGTAIHAFASELCEKELGKRSMLPSDLEHFITKFFVKIGY